MSPNSPTSPIFPSSGGAKEEVPKFKILVEASDTSFVREFATIKSLTQYKRRNPNLKGIEYTLYNGNWERFVIHGSQVIPESVLRSLLNSLYSSSQVNPVNLTNPRIEAPQPSPTNHLPQNPLF